MVATEKLEFFMYSMHLNRIVLINPCVDFHLDDSQTRCHCGGRFSASPARFSCAIDINMKTFPPELQLRASWVSTSSKFTAPT